MKSQCKTRPNRPKKCVDSKRHEANGARLEAAGGQRGEEEPGSRERSELLGDQAASSHAVFNAISIQFCWFHGLSPALRPLRGLLHIHLHHLGVETTPQEPAGQHQERLPAGLHSLAPSTLRCGYATSLRVYITPYSYDIESSI